jgi:hypothetical protein
LPNIIREKLYIFSFMSTVNDKTVAIGSMRFSEYGASLLEFTIILFVALPLLSATIDYGLGLRRLQVLAQAARLGVREAAATRAFAMCNTPSNGAGCVPTQYGENGEVVAYAQINSVACFGEVTARDFLLLPAHKNKMKVDDYDFKGQVFASPPVDGISPLIIRMEIKRKPSTIGCTFCYANAFKNIVDSVDSSMALVAPCT